MVKHRPTMWETLVQSLGQEALLEKEMATLSSILAWNIPWMEEPSRLQSMGSQSRTRLSDFTPLQTMVEVMKIMVTSLKRSQACTATVHAPTLQQASTGPRLHWRFPDTHRQGLWGHCPFSWVLVHKVLLCPPRIYFQFYVSTGSSMVGLMATSSKRT